MDFKLLELRVTQLDNVDVAFVSLVCLLLLTIVVLNYVGIGVGDSGSLCARACGGGLN